MHHAQPSPAGELEQPGGAAPMRMDVAAEAAFEARLCHQEIEIDAGFARGFPDAVHHRGRKPLPGDHSAKLRADGHGASLSLTILTFQRRLRRLVAISILP